MPRSPVVITPDLREMYEGLAQIELDREGLGGLVVDSHGQIIFSWANTPDVDGVYIAFDAPPPPEQHHYAEEGAIEFDDDGSAWIWVDDCELRCELEAHFITGTPVHQYAPWRDDLPERCQDRGCNAQQPWHPPNAPLAVRDWCVTCGGTLS